MDRVRNFNYNVLLLVLPLWSRGLVIIIGPLTFNTFKICCKTRACIIKLLKVGALIKDQLLPGSYLSIKLQIGSDQRSVLLLWTLVLMLETMLDYTYFYNDILLLGRDYCEYKGNVSFDVPPWAICLRALHRRQQKIWVLRRYSICCVSSQQHCVRPYIQK